MKVRSPIGDYHYRVKDVRVSRAGLEVDGSLGQWETTMVVEPSDLARPARYAVAATVAALLTTVAVRRRRS